MSLNKRKLCWQDPSEPHFEPGEFDGIGMDLLKDLWNFYIQARGARWEEGVASAIRFMRRHDGGSALRKLYEMSREAARKETMDEIKNGVKPTFKGIIHTIQLFHGPWIFDSMRSGRVIHPVRMWYTRDFMKDIKVDKLGIFPWYLTIWHKPEMYGKDKSDKWFIKNTVNK